MPIWEPPEPKEGSELNNPSESNPKNNPDININPENKPEKYGKEERNVEKKEKEEEKQTTKIYKIIKEKDGKVKRKEVKFTPQQTERIKIVGEAINKLNRGGRYAGSWGSWEIYKMSQRLARKEGMEITLNAVRHTLNIGGGRRTIYQKEDGSGK